MGAPPKAPFGFHDFDGSFFWFWKLGDSRVGLLRMQENTRKKRVKRYELEAYFEAFQSLCFVIETSEDT